MKTIQKVFIALLALYIVFAIIMLNVIPYETEAWIVGIIGAIMLIVGIWLYSSLKNKPVAFTQPNGEHPNALGTFMGIGTAMFGAFHFRELENTWVSYTFFCFILPLFPTGCYRVRMEGSQYGVLGTKTSWSVYGSEKGNVLEIVSIYLHLYGFLIWLFSVVFGLLFFL